MTVDDFKLDFDEKSRILHLGYVTQVHIKTKAQLDLNFKIVTSILDRYIETGKFYMIIDMANFILEPDLSSIYARFAKGIGEKYIMPGGIARYGHQITRVTVRRGYKDHINEDPNHFGSYQEAAEYIGRQVVINREADKRQIDPVN